MEAAEAEIAMLSQSAHGFRTCRPGAEGATDCLGCFGYETNFPVSSSSVSLKLNILVPVPPLVKKNPAASMYPGCVGSEPELNVA